MTGAGADVDVLLRGNAVNYAVQGQDASGLAFGDWKQTEPPRIAQDLASLIGKGALVYAIAEDLEQRGLSGAELVPGIEPIPMRALARLCGGYARIWHW
jgi:sulfur transfer complex TusBCD TusB component (DsrH family)